MCSLSDDIEELSIGNCTESTSEERVLKRNLEICKKCGEKSIVVLQKKDPFCKACFNMYCNHKFRATIGKSKKIKSGSRVLICHSGGLSSSAMVHMVFLALQDTSPKKFILRPGILNIDESFVANHDANLQSDILTLIEKSAQDLQTQVLHSSLDMALRNDENENFYWSYDKINENQNNKLKEKLNHILNGINSLTLKQEYIEKIRIQLMVDIAKVNGYSYIFLGDNATFLADRVLTNISLGRGSQVASSTAFYDSRYSVPVCRPLREILSRELAFYNQLNDVHYYVQPSLLTMTNTKGSVQRTTEKFVSDLQENFPSTVFTIFRTASKVSAKSSNAIQDTCVFCESVLDNIDPLPCSALDAMSLTSKLSKNVSSVSHNDFPGERCQDFNEKIDLKLNPKQHMCHGCLMLFNEMHCTHFSFSTIQRVSEKERREELREQIEEYLLEPNEDKTGI